eukprot:scaffold117492_cov57-Phaeocystis_antarctica.AAC.3
MSPDTKSERRSPTKARSRRAIEANKIRAGVERRHGRPRRPPLDKRRRKSARLPYEMLTTALFGGILRDAVGAVCLSL